MTLAVYSVALLAIGVTLGFAFGSRVEREVYKYYDAIGKLAHDDYEKVLGLLRKVREDI